MKPKRLAWLAFLLIASTTTTAPPALASEGVIEEIVVSATRRQESLQEVPLAVSALTAETLNKQGVFETSDLNRIAPNLQVSSPYGAQQPNFSLRGVGVGTEFNANAASPIGVYVDEVYQTFRPTHGQQLYDLEQVEVVRGPQGTLFGRNTTGGAINFITRKPELEGSNGYVAAGYGNYARTSIEAAVEFTPVADTVGIRIAGTHVETDPYLDNVLPAGPSTAVFGGASGLNQNTGVDPEGFENWGVRGAIRMVPNDNVDLMLKAYAAKSTGGTAAPIPTGNSKTSTVIDYTDPYYLLAPLVVGLNVAAPGALPTSYDHRGMGFDLLEVEMDSIGTALTKAEGVVLTADIGINDKANVIALIGYDSGDYEQLPTTDCDGTPLALCTIGYDSEFDAFTVDVRLNYESDRLSLIVGGFYGEDNIKTDNRPNFFNFLRDVNAALGLPPTYFNPAGFFSGTALSAASLPTGITAEQSFQQDRESYAFYAEGNYDLTAQLTLTIGLRYSDDKLDFSDGITTLFDDAGNPRLMTISDHTAGGAFAPYFVDDVMDEAGNVVIPAALVNPGPLPGGLQVEDGSSETSGRVILDWKPNEDLMLYASFSRGYRAGTFNGLAYITANQVYFVEPEEVDAFEAGFKSRFANGRLQLNGAAFRYDYTGQQGQVVDATATANLLSLDGKITGIELEMQWLAADNLTIEVAGGWLDSEYDSDDCPPGSLAGVFPGQRGSCVLSAGGEVDVGGNSFPYAPEITLNAGFEWDIAQVGAGLLTLHADASYTDDFRYDSFGKYTRGPLPAVASGHFADGGDSYWLFNGRLSWETDQLSVSLWGKNLGNEEYYPFGISIEGLFANGYRVIGPPRTYGMELRYSF